MAGRPLLTNNKKEIVASMYVSEEELKKLDDYIQNQCPSCSRSCFIRRIVMDRIDGKVEEQTRAITKKDIKQNIGMLFSALQDTEKKQRLFNILEDKEKTAFLFSMIEDSKFLTKEEV